MPRNFSFRQLAYFVWHLAFVSLEIKLHGLPATVLTNNAEVSPETDSPGRPGNPGSPRGPGNAGGH